MKALGRKNFWLRRSVYLGVLLAVPLTAATIRIVQTNSAGDNIHLIDPATNKVVGIIKGIEISHGATYSPDGTRYYISDEPKETLDVVGNCPELR